MEIADSARRHGIDDAAIEHALRNPVRVVSHDNKSLYIGADPSGKLLEIVVLDDDPDEEPLVIHAMPLRPKFYDYLR